MGYMDKIKKRELKDATTSITLAILDIICSIPEAMIGSFISQRDLIKKIKISEKYNSYPASYVNNLIKRGYIKRVVDSSGSKSVYLTHKGLIKHIEGNGELTKDGKWRFLSFDIPEKLRIKRDQFRRSIKRIGFKQVQKSLWGCPYINADQVDIIIEELNLRKYVGYIVAEKNRFRRGLGKDFQERIIKQNRTIVRFCL
jgi:DNA-binding transcriptional regulator PaaX